MTWKLRHPDDAATTCNMSQSISGTAATIMTRAHATFRTANLCPLSWPSGFKLCRMSHSPIVPSFPAVAMTGSYLFQSQYSTSTSLLISESADASARGSLRGSPHSNRADGSGRTRSKIHDVQISILPARRQDIRLTRWPRSSVDLAFM